MNLREYQEWQKAKKIKQYELAVEIGYSKTHLNEVFTGKKELSKPMERALEMFREIGELNDVINQLKADITNQADMLNNLKLQISEMIKNIE